MGCKQLNTGASAYVLLQLEGNLVIVHTFQQPQKPLQGKTRVARNFIAHKIEEAMQYL